MAGKEARQRQAWLPQGCVVVLTQGLPGLTAGIIESSCYPPWGQLEIPCGNKDNGGVGEWYVALTVSDENRKA